MEGEQEDVQDESEVPYVITKTTTRKYGRVSQRLSILSPILGEDHFTCFTFTTRKTPSTHAQLVTVVILFHTPTSNATSSGANQ